MTSSTTRPTAHQIENQVSVAADALAEARNLEVEVASGAGLDIRSFRVDERMSGLFEIGLVVRTPDSDLDFDAIVGRAARFRINHAAHSGFSARVWTGICRHVQQVAIETSGLSTYELTIVPDLWLLTQRRNFRIFQHVSEIDIARAILDEWGILLSTELSATYRPREYRVQYGESDYAFVSRMLEDAGIAFFLEQTDAGTRMVLTDAPQSRVGRETPLTYVESSLTTHQSYATKVRVSQEVRPGRYAVRDYDTRLAADFPLVAGAKAGAGVEDRLEQYDFVPGAFLYGGASGEGSPSADDRGTARSDETEATALAQRRLDAQRGPRKTVTFETAAIDLAPGVVFSIWDHPRADLAGTNSLLLVSSTHEGAFNQPWTHRCEARFTDAPYRPAQVTPKPRIAGVETATVVGAAGDEIHTDEFGRVRVAFHWDRQTQRDEKSSCWMHVSQPWGGSGYGGTNLPRVGQEVIVDFLSGDPDRPVITGRVYTSQQKTPFSLPANKTQSGWKSCSTQQTGGYNEIMFEDAAGRELVRMQAEKDLDKLVKNDERVVVGHDRTKLVKHDDKLTVNRDRTKVVDHDEDTTIGHDRRKQVNNDDDLTVGGNRQKRVERNEREMVALSRTRIVGLNESVAVGVNQSVKVGTNQNVSVGKSQKVTVKKKSTETVGVMKALTVGAMYQVSVGAVMNTTVGLSQSEQVGMTKQVNVGDKINVVCGRTSLTMEKAGKITWAIDGGASIVLEDKNIFITAGDGGQVVLTGGPEVHVNP